MQEVKGYKPKIVAFCCNWCSYAGADLAGNNRLNYPAEVKIIRVPCSCRVNPMFVLRAFQRGADGVILCGCHPGDCHYTSGNYYTRRRMALLFSMLNYLGIEKERTRVEWVSAAEGAKFAVGSLVERSIYCDGVIDDLRISRGIRKFSPETVPTEPLPLDDETLLLTRFDLTGIGSLAERNDALRRRLEASVPTEPASPVERFADVPTFSN